MLSNQANYDTIRGTMTVPEPYSKRLEKIRANMQAAGYGALLVFRPENRRYLSGYEAFDTQLDESSGCLFITRNKQILLTDFRYQLQAEKEAVGFDVEIYNNGSAGAIGSLANKFKVGKIGFEDDFMTVMAHRHIQNEIGSVKLEPSSGMTEELRLVKDDNEIKMMTKALRITEKALSETSDFIEAGKTEIEIARFLEERMMLSGAEGLAFETIVASGPNGALPHAVPTKRKIKEGDAVTIDCGAQFKGYKADMTRTFVLGEPRPWLKKIYGVVRQAQVEAIKAIKPGMKTDEADEVARRFIENAGYGEFFGHGLGHGVGLATHEAPSLSKRKSSVLKPGMVVTVEPGIYLPRKGGVRLEEMVLITEGGCRVLNKDRSFYRWDD